MEFQEKLRSYREQKGYTQLDVSKMMGVDKSTYCGYETGKRQPDVPKLKKLSSILGVSVDCLLETGYDLEREKVDVSHTTRIPILGQIAAGLPILAEQNIEGYTYTDLNGGAEYFGLRVKGDSMNAARINEGDVLIVRQQSEVENGQIAVVMVNGNEATVKRFYRSDNTITLMPQSTNPAHLPQVYNAAETPVRVIGLVVKNEITF